MVIFHSNMLVHQRVPTVNWPWLLVRTGDFYGMKYDEIYLGKLYTIALT